MFDVCCVVVVVRFLLCNVDCFVIVACCLLCVCVMCCLLCVVCCL